MSANNFLKAFSNFIKNPSSYVEDPLSSDLSRVPNIQVEPTQAELTFEEPTEELVSINEIRGELRIGHRTVCTVAAQLGFSPVRIGSRMCFSKNEVNKIIEEYPYLKKPKNNLAVDDQEFEHWLEIAQEIRLWQEFPKDRFTTEDVLQLIGNQSVPRLKEAIKYLKIVPFKHKNIDVYSEEQIRNLRERSNLSLKDLQRLNGSSREEQLPIDEFIGNNEDKQKEQPELKKENSNASDSNLHHRVSKAVERIDELQKNYEKLAKKASDQPSQIGLEKNQFFRDTIVNVHSEITKFTNQLNGRLDHVNRKVACIDRKVSIQDQCIETLDKNFSKLEAKSEKLHQTVSTNVDNLVQKVEAIPETEFTKEWMKSIDNSLIDHNYSILELKNSKPTVQDSSSADLETAIKSLELKEKLFDEFARRLSKMEESQNSINAAHEKAINGIVALVQNLSKQIEASGNRKQKTRKSNLDDSSMFKNFSLEDSMEAVLDTISKEYSKKNGSPTSFMKLARSYRDLFTTQELRRIIKELMINGLLAAKDDSNQAITAFAQITNLRATWFHPVTIDKTESVKVLKTTKPTRKVSLAELDVEFSTNGFDEDTPLVAYETYLKSVEAKEIPDKNLDKLYQQAAFLIDECNEYFHKKQRGKCVKEIHHWYIDNEGHRSPKSIFRAYAAMGYLISNDQILLKKKPNSHEYVVWERYNFHVHRENLGTQYVIK